MTRQEKAVELKHSGYNCYKHFKNKEDMFYYLVKDVLDAFERFAAGSETQMETDDSYDPFDDDWALFWVDFIYEYYDGIKLLICCSKGSAYESFEDKLKKSIR